MNQFGGEAMPATYNDLYLDARKALKAAGVEQALSLIHI